jgi:hypothetical protein
MNGGQRISSKFLASALRVAAMFLWAGLLISCRPALYNIAPLEKSANMLAGRSSSVGEFDISASAVLTDEEAFRRFDSNLILAGLLAVNVTVFNRGNVEKVLRVELVAASGEHWDPTQASKVLKRMMSFEGVRMYPLEAKRVTLANLEAQALPGKLAVAGGFTKQGIYFFDLKQDLTSRSGLFLRLTTSGKTSTIQLN